MNWLKGDWKNLQSSQDLRKKDAFNIIERKINGENSTWSEGFIAFNPEFSVVGIG